ncbi:MAG: RpiB/LacA/LacB family sugar-phosphate isomerase [Candidatus Levybacteria bacterium]|nr:RpiB/LacA/LacB family sugar-phosphate isomerase [Candidatus Levybacteria bacterium]
MKIYIGADHRGFKLKEEIKKYFYENGIEYEDLGAYELDPDDDYPIYAERVSNKVSQDLNNANDARGILLCGSGVGVDIVANKFEHIRSGLGINAEQVKSARRDDDVNVLAIASDETPEQVAREMVKAFLETEFEPSKKHTRRLKEIDEIEDAN